MADRLLCGDDMLHSPRPMMTDMDIFYMEKALSLAQDAARKDEVPVGAVIVRSDGFIAGTGQNTREAERSVLGHAEINAISAACKALGGYRLSDCTLYVTMEPCPMCAGACISAGVKRIVFGAYDSKNGAVSSVTRLCECGFTSSPEVSGGIMSEECSALLTDFFRNKRKNKQSVTFSDIVTDDQYMRCAAMLSCTAEDIRRKEQDGCCFRFIRKNGKAAGVIAVSGDHAEIFINKEYKAYLSESEVRRAFYGEGYSG
ncbi:MAG: nucleoside deaminase [Oscillospiraceae bacterium]